jgi:hypothetical protein
MWRNEQHASWVKIAFTDQDIIDWDSTKDVLRVKAGVAPGTAKWSTGQDGQIAVLHYACPCGCGDCGSVPVKVGYGGPHWVWSGDLVNPTLTPSIQKTTGCRWHGYLTNGEWIRV